MAEISMTEKREIIRGQTLHGRAISEANQEQGRFAKINRVEITGVPRYPRISGPWSQSIDAICGPEPLSDQTDCGDTYTGEPIGSPAEIEATSAPSTPCAQTMGRGSTAYAPAPPVEKFPASPGGASLSTSNFKRRV